MRGKIAECWAGFIQSKGIQELHLLSTGTYLIAVPACSSFPTLVINSAGRNNLTHIFEISREEEDLKIFVLEAITP